ncbi:polysaccharide pyruvyl transferase family protein [Vibrio sp. Evd11]|uniref:polysaccharide pyruvyl transferase family protein n=1 Tax=Vibrio sp. Evd11 TaxID=1207404 RepID=UPI000EFCA06C|nr:polysaccharide pyruvyl transferase family protein [Vibrio sp. Evd11]
MNTIDYYLKKYCPDANITYVELGVNWKNSEFLKRKIIQSDKVIVNGEGTIHHNTKNGKLLIELAKFSASYDVKSFLINMTYQDNDESYIDYLKYFNRIYVRESYSHKQLEDHNISSKVIPDLSLFNDQENKSKKNGKYLITDSVKKDITKELLDKFSHHPSTSFISVFNENIFYKSKSKGSTLMRIIRNNSFKNILSKSYNALKKRITSEKILPIFYVETHQEYDDEISRHKLALCGRFHTMMFCINNGTPFIALKSNSHKVEGVINDIGLDVNKFIVDINKIDIDYLDDFILTDNERELIKGYRNIAKSKIDSMFKDILSYE